MKRLFSILTLIWIALTGWSGKSLAQVLSVPADFGAVRVYPNPWRSDRHSASPVTFDRLPESTVTTLRVYTIAGEHVRTMSGTGTISWDLRTQHGETVASGIYLYLLHANPHQRSGKIAVIR